MKLHPALQTRLKETKERYEQVTLFAEKLPMFADQIISSEHTGDSYCSLARHYKGMYFNWDINWGAHRPTNYPEDQPCEIGLVNVYINCMSLFHDDLYSFARSELDKVVGKIKYYFYDDLNSTFYFKPDEVEAGLDAIVEWYNSTKAYADAQLKEIKRKELKRQLKELQ